MASGKAKGKAVASPKIDSEVEPEAGLGPSSSAGKRKVGDKEKGKYTKTGRRKQRRDPAPKRARTAFNFFLADFRQKYLIEHPETRGVIQITKASAQAWKTLSKEEKEPYEKKAKLEKEEHARAKAEYLASGGPEKFKSTKRQGKRKRRPTAYFCFLAEMREKLKREHRGKPLGVIEISKLTGAKWRSLSKEEKEPYEKMAADYKVEGEEEQPQST